MTFSERLVIAMNEKGVTAAELAKMTSISEGAISHYKKGTYKAAQRNLEVLAKALDVSIPWLMGNAVPMHDQDSSKEMLISEKGNKTGFVSHDALKIAESYDKLDEDSKRTVWAVVESELKRRTGVIQIEEARKRMKRIPLLPNSFAAGPGEPDFGNEVSYIEVSEDSRADFAIKVTGDSMEPWLKDGSIAYGVKGAPDDGEVGAFLVDGEYKVKQCCVDAFGNLYLFSLNRQRKDTDDTILRSAERSVVCFGKILVDKLPGLPHEL